MNHDRVIEGIHARFGDELKRDYVLGNVRENYEDLVARVLSKECYEDERHLQAALLAFYLSIPSLGCFGKSLASKGRYTEKYIPLRALVGGEEILDRLIPRSKRLLLARVSIETSKAVCRALGIEGIPHSVREVVQALGFLPKRLLAGSADPGLKIWTRNLHLDYEGWSVVYVAPLVRLILKGHKKASTFRTLFKKLDTRWLLLDDPDNGDLLCLSTLAPPNVSKAISVMGSNTMRVLDVYRKVPYPCGVEDLGIPASVFGG